MTDCTDVSLNRTYWSHQITGFAPFEVRRWLLRAHIHTHTHTHTVCTYIQSTQAKAAKHITWLTHRLFRSERLHTVNYVWTLVSGKNFLSFKNIVHANTQKTLSLRRGPHKTPLITGCVMRTGDWQCELWVFTPSAVPCSVVKDPVTSVLCSHSQWTFPHCHILCAACHAEFTHWSVDTNHT